jgi:hypothetical protein
LILISLITETYDLVPPNTEELNLWADEYGQTFPVLSDAEPVAERFTSRGSLSLPSHTLIGPGAVVLIADGDVGVEDILEALP